VSNPNRRRTIKNRVMTILRLLILTTIAGVAAAGVFAQTAPRKKNPKPAPTVAAEPTPTPNVAEPEKSPAKRNERPTNGNGNGTKSESKAAVPNYYYEYTQPEFIVSRIVIEHDENGVGRFSFRKKDWDEGDSEPLQISPAALERIKAAFTALDFLNSTESYQYEKDYSHLGNVVIRLRREGRERETKFNWTVNKEAKVLYDEYRRVANQALFVFDMNVARVNQPLDSPKLLNGLESQIRRNEISDPAQLVPYLRELSNDERLPLIARNKAKRMIDSIGGKK
jgi:hypothetical protein